MGSFTKPTAIANGNISDETDVNNLSDACDTAFTAVDGDISDLGDGTVPAGSLLDAGVGAGTLKLVKIPIGDWDMDLNGQVSVAHGLTYSQIIGLVSCSIRADASVGDSLIPIWYASGGVPQGTVSIINSTNVVINREAGGVFDSINYNQTSYNRGWIILLIEV
jgi:hypothetical protein